MKNALVCVCVCSRVVAALFAEHLGVLCIFDHVNVNNLQFLVAYFGKLPTKKAPSANNNNNNMVLFPLIGP